MALEIQKQDQAPITAATLEAVVVGGDLAKLTPAQRLEWYSQRCHAAGLDPRTQPFQYIPLSGKLTLYATKAATDQLINIHRLKVELADRRADADLGVYEVVCRVTRVDGTTVDDMAAVSIAGLKGESLCNAYMKCATKAKRRTVLSACGLGMLDESEVETIPGARVVQVDPRTGELPPATDSAGGAASPAAWKMGKAEERALQVACEKAGVTGAQMVDLIEANFRHRKYLTLDREQFATLRDNLIPAEGERLRREANEPIDVHPLPLDGPAAAMAGATPLDAFPNRDDEMDL